MVEKPLQTRRQFFVAAALSGGASLEFASSHPKEEDEEEDVAPAEDLMREHSVLRRILLIYKDTIRRIENRQDLVFEPISEAASLIRRFVEDYHEKLEEEQLFPRFRKSNILVSLVDVLSVQHQKGRLLTTAVQQFANPASLNNPTTRSKLIQSLSQFIRMYEPHAAREDTVLFPAFKKIISAREYYTLGDQFEEKENQLFGYRGFEKIVDEVGSLEKSLGIYDLAEFTPKI